MTDAATMPSRRRWLLAGACVVLSACAGRPPAGLEPPSPDAPTQRMAQQAPEQYRGRVVRWGGEILVVTNQARATEFEILGRPLLDHAEPQPEGGDAVRFIAVIGRFLDPAEYRPGKRLTVVGHLRGNRQRSIGAYPYPYPVVDVENYHLWPAHQTPVEAPAWRYPHDDPWWPWGPYRHWPYYR